MHKGVTFSLSTTVPELMYLDISVIKNHILAG